jgi:hypothetical protein
MHTAGLYSLKMVVATPMFYKPNVAVDSNYDSLRNNFVFDAGQRKNLQPICLKPNFNPWHQDPGSPK